MSSAARRPLYKSLLRSAARLDRACAPHYPARALVRSRTAWQKWSAHLQLEPFSALSFALARAASSSERWTTLVRLGARTLSSHGDEAAVDTGLELLLDMDREAHFALCSSSLLRASAVQSSATISDDAAARARSALLVEGFGALAALRDGIEPAEVVATLTRELDETARAAECCAAVERAEAVGMSALERLLRSVNHVLFFEKGFEVDTTVQGALAHTALASARASPLVLSMIYATVLHRCGVEARVFTLPDPPLGAPPAPLDGRAAARSNTPLRFLVLVTSPEDSREDDTQRDAAAGEAWWVDATHRGLLARGGLARMREIARDAYGVGEDEAARIAPLAQRDVFELVLQQLIESAHAELVHGRAGRSANRMMHSWAELLNVVGEHCTGDDDERTAEASDGEAASARTTTAWLRYSRDRSDFHPMAIPR